MAAGGCHGQRREDHATDGGEQLQIWHERPDGLGCGDDEKKAIRYPKHAICWLLTVKPRVDQTAAASTGTSTATPSRPDFTRLSTVRLCPVPTYAQLAMFADACAPVRNQLTPMPTSGDCSQILRAEAHTEARSEKACDPMPGRGKVKVAVATTATKTVPAVRTEITDLSQLTSHQMATAAVHIRAVLVADATIVATRTTAQKIRHGILGISGTNAKSQAAVHAEHVAVPEGAGQLPAADDGFGGLGVVHHVIRSEESTDQRVHADAGDDDRQPFQLGDRRPPDVPDRRMNALDSASLIRSCGLGNAIVMKYGTFSAISSTSTPVMFRSGRPPRRTAIAPLNASSAAEPPPDSQGERSGVSMMPCPHQAGGRVSA